MSQPDLLQQAVEHHQAGRLAQAEQLYRQILTLDPNQPDALHYLGLIAHSVGQYQNALELIQRAIALRPDDPLAHGNLSIVLCGLSRFDDAIISATKAVTLRASPTAYLNLGNALKGAGRLEESADAFAQAIKLNPNYVDAIINLASVQQDMGRFDLAIVEFERAIAISPSRADAHFNLANALYADNQPDRATAQYHRAISLRPDYIKAFVNLGNVLKDIGRLDESLAAYSQAVALAPQISLLHSNLLYTQLFHPAYDSRRIANELKSWNDTCALPLRRDYSFTNDRSSSRRLRIGYVSPDFRQHVVGRNILPLLREHDRAKFEIFCYSSVAFADPFTAHFEQRSDHYRNVARLDDDSLADLIHSDQIDILVDLSLHLANNRLSVFARKPAPVQFTFAGYPGSTGLTCIDYRLSDPYLDPADVDETLYSEKTIRLPHSFWCYDKEGMSLEDSPAPGPLPAMKNGYITFGCFNNFCKITEPMLRLWGQILSRVPNSRLMLLCKPGQHRDRVRQFFAASGTEASRIEFTPFCPRSDYLKVHQQIDIALDTVPYNGHTTSLDALWMGVPVVTLVGRTIVGRAGLSQLMNLNLPDLIATDDAGYIECAVRLAGDSGRLVHLRSTLRQAMQASPLMDAKVFARAIENAYRTAWQKWTTL